MSRIDEIVKLMKQVPPYPKVAHRVMSMLEGPNVTPKDLSEVIQYDAAITANILKVCNSSYFSLPRKVVSLDDAVVVLGHDTLKDILITSSSAAFYKGKAGDGYFLEQGELWRHSVASAIMARLLVKHFFGVQASSAFTGGLLHDIGKIFLSTFVASDFEEILQRSTNENIPFIEAEKLILGIDHSELGAMLLEQWKFPDDMILAVRNHHDPDVLSKEPLSALVALSNALVVSIGIGVGADGLTTQLHMEGVKRFHIGSSELEIAMLDLVAELSKAEELMNLTS